MKFRLTSYGMGSARQEKNVEGTLTDAMSVAERMTPYGLPGTHPQARGVSLVVGVIRLREDGSVVR